MWAEVFKNRVLRKILRPKRDKTTRQRSKAHNETLFNNHYYYLANLMKSRRMSWEQHVAHMGEKRTVYRVWEGKHAGKRPVGRPRYRQKHNIKIYVE